MVKGSGYGQSTMCTPVTNIYKNDQKKHSGLGCLFPCGTSVSKGFLRDNSSWEEGRGGGTHVRISKDSSSSFLSFTS